MKNPNNQVILSPQTQLILGGVAAGFAQAFEAASSRIIADMHAMFGATAAKNKGIYNYAFSSQGNAGTVTIPATTALVTANFRVNEDSDFVGLRALVIAVNGTGVVQTNPSFTIQMINTGADRNLQNFPIHIQAFAGNAQNCVPFATEMIWPRSALVEAIFQNVETATALTAFVSIWGYKRYDRAAVNEQIRH